MSVPEKQTLTLRPQFIHSSERQGQNTAVVYTDVEEGSEFRLSAQVCRILQLTITHSLSRKLTSHSKNAITKMKTFTFTPH